MIECGLAEEVEGHLGLDKEETPKVLWKGGVNTGKDGQELGFEGLDGLFGGVATVDIWGNKLEPNLLIFPNNAFGFGAGFVVEDLKVSQDLSRVMVEV